MSDQTPHTVTVQAQFRNVVLENATTVPNEFPIFKENEGIIVDTEAEYEIDDGELGIRFKIECLAGKRGEKSAASLFKASVLCSNLLLADGVPLPMERFPQLSEQFIVDLIHEAYATFRGYLASVLSGTILSSLILPYANPKSFLGDLQQMLETKTFPESMRKSSEKS